MLRFRPLISNHHGDGQTGNDKLFPFIVAAAAAAIMVIFVIAMELGLESNVGVSLLLCWLGGLGLVPLCQKRIMGGVYVLFSLFLCHTPTFLFAKANSISFSKCLYQGLFFLSLLALAFCAAVALGYWQSAIRGRLPALIIKVAGGIILLLPVALPFCYLINWSFANPILGVDAVLAFLQTDYSEANEYIKEFLSIKKLLWLLAAVAVILVADFKTISGSFVYNRKLMYVIAGAGIAAGAGIFCFSNVATAPFIAARENLLQYAKFHEMRKEIGKTIAREENNRFKGTFVIVIGESLSRMQMGLYGYNRDNTPWQATLANSDKAIVFTNAFSNHTHTVPALSLALTQKNQYDHAEIPWEKAVSLLDIAKYAAGFHTVWISNQVKLGPYDTPISSIASSADWQYFTTRNYLSKMAEMDGVLLDKVKSLKLNADKNLIFIHLMGNHIGYDLRYPESFTMFKDGSPVDTYDNSVYYNDYVLQQIFATASAWPDFQGMLYCPDHGEDPWRKMGHNSAAFTWDMAKIPLWMIFSPAYIASHPDVVANLRAHRDAPFTNDLLFDTVLGLLGIVANEYYNSGNDLSSGGYRHSYADLKTLHGRKSLSVLPDESSLRKIWLHRVNSPEKLRELGERYCGLEFDVIWHADLDSFENSHNPSGTPEKYPLEAQLATLRTLKDWKGKRLWFDFKNLTSANKVQAEKRLRELLAQYDIPQANCWVESQNWRDLDIFRQNKWRTSYYFPGCDLSRLSANEKDDVKRQTVMISQSGNVNAISFSGRYYDFITTMELNPEIDLLTWFSGVPRRDFECFERYFPIIKNPRIKAILVKELGHHNR